MNWKYILSLNAFEFFAATLIALGVCIGHIYFGLSFFRILCLAGIFGISGIIFSFGHEYKKRI